MFTISEESHAHSRETLEEFCNHIEFLQSIKRVCDIGCGKEQLDINYWATLTDQDEENPQPLNIKCTALDIVQPPNLKVKNVRRIKQDFNLGLTVLNDKSQDIVWCHDSLQFAHSPLDLLFEINRILDPQGMLYLYVPSTINVYYGRFESYCCNNQLFTFTLPQLIYLLAIAGFDVKDAYFRKPKFVDGIDCVVYKNSEPLDKSTTWGDLVDKDLLSASARDVVLAKNYLSDQGLLTQWLNGEVFDYRYNSRA
jgi:SAM-dependent methyltransferase